MAPYTSDIEMYRKYHKSMAPKSFNNYWFILLWRIRKKFPGSTYRQR